MLISELWSVWNERCPGAGWVALNWIGFTAQRPPIVFCERHRFQKLDHQRSLVVQYELRPAVRKPDQLIDHCRWKQQREGIALSVSAAPYHIILNPVPASLDDP